MSLATKKIAKLFDLQSEEMKASMHIVKTK